MAKALGRKEGCTRTGKRRETMYQNKNIGYKRKRMKNCYSREREIRTYLGDAYGAKNKRTKTNFQDGKAKPRKI